MKPARDPSDSAGCILFINLCCKRNNCICIWCGVDSVEIGSLPRGKRAFEISQGVTESISPAALLVTGLSKEN